MSSGRLVMPRGIARIVVLSLVVCLVGIAGLASSTPSFGAPAQACDPAYGCTTTSTPTSIAGFSCHAVFHGSPGAPQSVDVSGAPPGARTEVLFNGNVIASGTADGNGNVTVNYQVPANVTGNVQVVVAGLAVSAVCDPALSAISGEATSANAAPASLLAHTGFSVLLFVLAALALAAAGWLMQRRRTARQARR